MIFDGGFCGSVGIRFLDPAVWVLSYPGAIRKEDILLSASVLNGLDPILLNPLNGSISEDGLFLAVCKDALDRAVREATQIKKLKKSSEYYTYMISLVPSG